MLEVPGLVPVRGLGLRTGRQGHNIGSRGNVGTRRGETKGRQCPGVGRGREVGGQLGLTAVTVIALTGAEPLLIHWHGPLSIPRDLDPQCFSLCILSLGSGMGSILFLIFLLCLLK